MRWISLLLVVLFYGCTKKVDLPYKCIRENTAYHQIGDTIHLTFCSSEYHEPYKGTVSKAYWVIVNEQNEIVFENRNQNTYFIINDSGYYRILRNTSNGLEIPPINSEEIYSMTFKTHSYITVYTNDVNFNTPYEITLKDEWNNIIGVDTVSSYDPNSPEECNFNSNNANFEINSAQEYYLYGRDINDTIITWSETLLIYGDDVYCKKVELEF